jgi:hypothetical protein
MNSEFFILIGLTESYRYSCAFNRTPFLSGCIPTIAFGDQPGSGAYASASRIMVKASLTHSLAGLVE